MDLIDENDGKEQESAGLETDVQAVADEPSTEADEGSGQDAEPQATPEEDEKRRVDDHDDPLSVDFMDIFESEDMIEPSVAIPGLQNLTMSEVASQTESALEDVKSRFP